jgi:hypothetical protein
MAALIVTTVTGSSFEIEVESHQAGVEQALFFLDKQVRRETERGTEFHPGHQIAKIEVTH